MIFTVQSTPTTLNETELMQVVTSKSQKGTNFFNSGANSADEKLMIFFMQVVSPEDGLPNRHRYVP